MKALKKIISIAAVLVAATSLWAKPKAKAQTIKVGATPVPHEEMLNLIKGDLKSAGYELKVVPFTDYVTPNEALESGDIDANFFQHIPYLDSFNKERGYHLVNAGGIHIEPFALYSRKIKKLSELKDGAKVAVPNDPTNEGRAFLLLQSAGLIKLKDGVGLEATPKDILSNPKNLKFSEIEAASLTRVLPDVDVAAINGNYALDAGLTAAKDGLFVEGADSPYVNVVAVKAGRENSPEIKALVKALQSKKVANWVKSKYPNGEVVTTF